MKSLRLVIVSVIFCLTVGTSLFAGKIRKNQAFDRAQNALKNPQLPVENKKLIDQIRGEITAITQKNNGMIEEQAVDLIIENALLLHAQELSAQSASHQPQAEVGQTIDEENEQLAHALTASLNIAHGKQEEDARALKESTLATENNNTPTHANNKEGKEEQKQVDYELAKREQEEADKELAQQLAKEKHPAAQHPNNHEQALEAVLATSTAQQEEDALARALKESTLAADNNNASTHANNKEGKEEQQADHELAKKVQEEADRELAQQLAKEKHPAAQRPNNHIKQPDNNDEIELARALQMINKQYEKQDPVYGTILKLPGELEKLPLIHLTSDQQYEDITCGSRATINAWAIQTLLEENKSLTAHTIQEKAQERSMFIEKRQLHGEEIYTLAQKLLLENASFYILGFALKHILSVSIEKPFTDEILEEQIKQIKDEEIWCLHFICNTGLHWVLISFVKQAGKNPVILYLNSTNAPLTQEHQAYTYITQLYNKHFAQLHAPKEEV